MLERLVEWFWTRHNERNDPDVVVACRSCGTPVRRGDATGALRAYCAEYACRIDAAADDSW